MYHNKFMLRAIQMSTQAMDSPGTEPFASVIVKDGHLVGEGINRAVMNLDPTSHGEIEAIRDACRTLGTIDLRGCEIYTNCEPCALCVAAMQIVGIAQLYYGAGLAMANSALCDVPDSVRLPIDARRVQEECGRPISERSMPSEQVLSDKALEVIVAWAEQTQAAPQK